MPLLSQRDKGGAARCFFSRDEGILSQRFFGGNFLLLRKRPLFCGNACDKIIGKVFFIWNGTELWSGWISVIPGENGLMRQYMCECQKCQAQQNYIFDEPFPSVDDVFDMFCKNCGETTAHKRVLTRKARSEINAYREEQALRQSIIAHCESYGFQCRFLYESVIITTPISSWQFGYHESMKTLRHESTVKINFETGDRAKTHEQFRDRKMSCNEVIDYIAKHDQWRQEQNRRRSDETGRCPG